MNFPPSWTAEEDKTLIALRATCTNREIARVLTALGFNRTPEGVRKRAKLLGAGKFLEIGIPTDCDKATLELLLFARGEQPERTTTPPIPVKPSVKASTTSMQRAVTNELFEQLIEIREQVERKGSGWLPVRESKPGKHSLVIILSDFHVGKIVELGENGETYNIEVALARINSIREQVILFLREHENKIDEVVFVLAGDLVDGEGIYPGQEMHLETHVADQIKAVVTGLWRLISNAHTPWLNSNKHCPVHVVSCRGNHGRTNLSDEANWDNIIYQQLELLVDMTSERSLTIKNLYGNYNTFSVKGWKGLVRHSAPPQADTGGAIAKFAGWYSIHEYDFMVYAHFHHWGVMTWNGKPLFRNGSLGGGDDYAEGFGASDEPTQLMFTVSEEKLVESIRLLTFGD